VRPVCVCWGGGEPRGGDDLPLPEPGAHKGPKPGFEGEEGKPVQAERVMMKELLQRCYSEESAQEPEALRPWVR
jgi:hypothetical protein